MYNTGRGEMPNYQNGKIYKIESLIGGLVYVGSTTRALSERLGDHVRKHKQFMAGKAVGCTSFEVLNFPDYKILLVESCPCDTKEQLHTREAEHIRNIECVNKVVPLRSPAEHYADNKERIQEYRAENKERIDAYHANYRETHKGQKKAYDEANRETQREKAKIRNAEKKEQRAASNKRWREANKEWLKTYSKTDLEKIACPVCKKVMGIKYLQNKHHKKAHPGHVFPLVMYNPLRFVDTPIAPPSLESEREPSPQLSE